MDPIHDPIQQELEELADTQPDIVLSVKTTFTFNNTTHRFVVAPGRSGIESVATVHETISRCGLDCRKPLPTPVISGDESLLSLKLTDDELSHTYQEGSSQIAQSVIDKLFPLHSARTQVHLKQIRKPDPESRGGRKGCKAIGNQHSTALLSEQTETKGYLTDDLLKDVSTNLNERRCRVTKEPSVQGTTKLQMTWYDCNSTQQ
ncbi:uncharacterized protein I206_103563 [Kwoniella pini CBS 10737]|uniref:Uncharacterized protein n=1 Tax=Kwoniella pini CBS 10737 TaxID=1296096 RepID=A0A1B9I978_9TREE|nr:uncharacterized protein I206_01433 [Kwoniella pini CBS 10737]OCF52148.1 hypothetical protein I206_01433 [Kwoniella pini CBS 10737]